MKKFFIFILACLLCLGLASCAADNTAANAEAEEKPDRFVMVYDSCTVGDRIKIWVDTETKVMYMHIKDGYGAGLAVMMDETGNPLLWEDVK